MTANKQHVPTLRLDIQALRGVAVLMVLFYHVKIGGVAAGYLGVDMFFVISGYLITSLVAAGIERGDFRLADFYFRRAKRLLPAAYVTILVTASCAPWFLNQQDLKDFGLQVIGAITFTANMVLWQQTGYFEGASDLKPLLHTWSLSLEEQYYLLLPAALLLLRRGLWLKAVLAALLVSFALCLLGGVFKPVATFYLLPTRAWELLIGSAGALIVRTDGGLLNRQIGRSLVIRAMFYPSLACVLLLGMFPVIGRHPGSSALLICLATLVVILRRHDGLEGALATKVLARVGDISYSLYLVHWPIIVFLKHAWVGHGSELPASLRVAALGLSLVLAYWLNRFIEDPLRKAPLRYSPALLVKTGLVSVLLMAIVPVTVQATKAEQDFAGIRRVNLGFGGACEYTTPFVLKPECSSKGQPKTLVWGDSYAMHLVPGLVSQAQTGGIVQATRSACGPFLNFSPKRLNNAGTGPVYDTTWAQKCIEFNQSVLDYIREYKNIEVVVLSSPLVQYVDEEWAHVSTTPDGLTETPASIEGAAAALKRTAAEIRATGKKLVFFSPPPAADFNVGACLERHITGLITLGGEVECAVPLDVYHKRRASVLKLMDAMESGGVPVIRLADFLCSARSCVTMIDGTLVYRDEGHLSYDGSRLLAARMNWAELIQQRAR